MTKRVITTVGTSIFTNYMKKEVRESAEYRDDYTSIDNLFQRLEKVGYPVPIGLKTDFDEIKTTLRTYWLDKYRPEASAEISSLLKIAGTEKVEVYLLATETALSVAACQLIQEYLISDKNTAKDKFIEVHFVESEDIIEGLQVYDADRFESVGLENLMKRIDKIGIPNQTILNISGGYKGLIPIVTLIGQLKNYPIIYLYEESNEPIELSSKAFAFDWSLIERFFPFLQSERVPFIQDKKIIKELFGYGLIKSHNGRFKRTIVGELLFRQAERQLPFAKTVLGFWAEYKFLEYYLNHPYCFIDDDSSTVVSRPNDTIINNKDIDLLFRNDNGFATMEIKSILKLNFMKELKTQISDFLDNFNVGYIPREYCLGFYLDNAHGASMEQFNDKLIEIHQLVKSKFSDTKFRVFYSIIGRNTTDSKFTNELTKYSRYPLDSITEYQIKFTSNV